MNKHYFWVKIDTDDWRIAEFEEESGDFYLTGTEEIFFSDDFEEIGNEIGK